MMKAYLPFGLMLAVLLSSCSHSKPEPDATAHADAATPAPTPELLSMPTCGKDGCGSSSNDYLNSVALPKILKASVVHECFLSNPRASSRELKPGYLTFRFEIKLITEGERVVVDQVYLSSFQNVPEWTKPCLIKGYKKLLFPAFTDKTQNSTKAFGNVSISWNPKNKK